MISVGDRYSNLRFVSIYVFYNLMFLIIIIIIFFLVDFSVVVVVISTSMFDSLTWRLTHLYKDGRVVFIFGVIVVVKSIFIWKYI
jgi:hypothetical protein